ncbi:AraC family transcriptional regulator [Paenibacillus jamilae]|uniref:AraC family transcriptional regulator n=1 Tax=Paenibacillus jamilae TaxID=114136 RepID=A0ACC4ZYB9_9BACL|nr:MULTISPECIES: response regulator [Paenibacillus]AUO07339.1 DNA-binding response regulator [Paenibacillus sp. lzh-N1]KTS83815.1 AraC family transcriptional regulator [Paenibacillus jamilae]
MNSIPLGVLVVDDETRQRRGLAAMVRDLRPEYEVWEAKNGQDALNISLSQPIQIVFTDIQMPIMNGIEYLQQLRTSGQHETKVILVTVYQEFSYAQQAVRYGANDYLVKPVQSQQLIEVIQHMEKIILEEQEVLGENRTALNQIEQSMPAFVEHLFSRCVTDKLQSNEKSLLKSHFGWQGVGEVLALGASASRPEDIYMWDNKLRNTVVEILRPWASSVVFPLEVHKDHMIAVVNWRDRTEGKEAKGALQAGLKKVEQQQAISIWFAWGQPFDFDEMQISPSHERAVRLISMRFYTPHIRCLNLVASDDDQPVQELSTHEQIAFLKFVESAISNGKPDQLLEWVQHFIGRMTQGYPPPDALKAKLIHLLLVSLPRLNIGWSEEVYSRYSEQLNRAVEEATCLQNLEDRIAAWLKELILELDGSSKGEPIMKKCKEFLDTHLHEDLSLEIVARRFHYNASYFSILFKNYFGLSFTEYMVKLRMQKAQHLLLHTDAKVAEISRQVGYKDIKYFFKVFKKNVKHTPEEFRRKFN